MVSTDPQTGLSELAVKNKFAVGDELELVTPAGKTRFRLQAMQDLNGKPVQEALGGGWQVRAALPCSDAAMGLLARVQPAAGAAE